MYFRQIEDPYLAQYAYLIGCQATGEALLIDPERDIDRYVEIAMRNNLRIVAVAETHIHADFVSGAREFAQNYPVKIYLSAEGGKDWQYEWEANPPARILHLKHGDVFHVGNIEIEAVHTPGHTPEHLCYMITDRGGGADDAMGLISGDFVFVGDVGRPDLLETSTGEIGSKDPSARALYRSLLEFFQLPDYLQLWPGHGAGSACGKVLGAIPESTVGYERRFNSSLRAAQNGEDSFVESILHGQSEPPLYFAQMKRWNKQGPPLLPTEFKLPAIPPVKLPELADDSNTVIIDTRSDPVAFFRGHVKSSVWVPLSKSFPSYAGSLIMSGQKVAVLCHDSQAEQAVRLLWRVGLDNIHGYIPVREFDEWVKKSRPTLNRIRTTTFSSLMDDHKGRVRLDVRGEAEVEKGRLPKSVCIPHTRILCRLSELPRDQHITVFCSAGTRAIAVSSLLARLGFNVDVIDENIEAAEKYLVRGLNMN